MHNDYNKRIIALCIFIANMHNYNKKLSDLKN